MRFMTATESDLYIENEDWDLPERMSDSAMREWMSDVAFNLKNDFEMILDSRAAVSALKAKLQGRREDGY